jgi:hypothetical protein
MRSTGPVLAMGAIVLGNEVVLNGRSIRDELRVPVGTAIVAGMLALVEKAWPDGAVALAWLGLVTVLLVRIQPNQPAPVENLSKFFNASSSGLGGKK